MLDQTVIAEVMYLTPLFHVHSKKNNCRASFNACYTSVPGGHIQPDKFTQWLLTELRDTGWLGKLCRGSLY